MKDMAEKAQPSVWFVVAGLMLATFLAALDGSIVSTAMPTITGLLGGFGLYSWVFSIYLLTSTVMVPIFGKLADLFGRKRVILFGIILFLAGSALCGSAQNMLQLIIYRGIQGIGSGAILPIATTILGDLFPPAERAKIQGWMGSVWGISAVIGPAVGGLIVDNISWRWIFYINLPVGLLAILVILSYYHEHLSLHSHRIDYPGAITLMLGTTLLLLGLTSGGRDWAWLSLQSILIFAVSIVSLLIFLFVETRAPEPILPLSLFGNRLIAVAGLAGLLIGGVMTGVVTYVPLFVQGALSSTATIAGGVMATMSIGWPVAGWLAGYTILRWGYRLTAFIGGLFLLLSVVMFLLVSATTVPLYIALCSFVTGLGLGFATTSFIVGIQSEVSWERRGIATASNLFLRSLGSTIWVAALGSVVTNTLVAQTRAVASELPANENSLDLVNALLDPVRAHALSPAILDAVRLALAQAFHSVFVWELITAFIALLIITAMPKAQHANPVNIPLARSKAEEMQE